MANTTIQVDTKTRDRLAKLKEAGGGTYDALLQKLLALVPEADEEGEYTDAFRIGLLNARLDVVSGRLHDHDAVKKRLGL